MKMNAYSRNDFRRVSIAHLRKMQHKSGLFSAASVNVITGYDKAWIRDNLYEATGLEHSGNLALALKTYQALLDIMLKHELKIDHAILTKPDAAYKYIHPRYHPVSFDEFYEPWGNKQNDAVGFLLFKIGKLDAAGVPILRNEADRRIVSKLVQYLASIEYWQDRDNGIWEENEELHASSLGACVAGLKAVRHIVDVPQSLIQKGEQALQSLLPRESETKETDLALLSLIYPFDVVSWNQRLAILEAVEQKLIRQRGCIRYAGDKYYNQSGEAEWCFAFPWLAKIYKDMGDSAKHTYYLSKTHEAMNDELELPELYYSNSTVHNTNSPLGWGQALYLVATEGNHAHGENKIETSRFIPS